MPLLLKLGVFVPGRAAGSRHFEAGAAVRFAFVAQLVDQRYGAIAQSKDHPPLLGNVSLAFKVIEIACPDLTPGHAQRAACGAIESVSGRRRLSKSGGDAPRGVTNEFSARHNGHMSAARLHKFVPATWLKDNRNANAIPSPRLFLPALGRDSGDPHRRPSPVGTNAYSVAIPADKGVVLPGYYWLFALSSSGIPGLSKTINIA